MAKGKPIPSLRFNPFRHLLRKFALPFLPQKQTRHIYGIKTHNSNKKKQLFEVPSNLVLKKFHPGRYISFLTIVFGIIATCTGLVQTYGQMIAVRLLLGIFEAGLFPGLLTYLTMFYTKKQLALRVGYLFVSAALAGAFGGLIAYGIGYMDGTCGMRAWRVSLLLLIRDLGLKA